ncbi:MAG: hypothetical protein ACU83V_00980 [Gammaproteobacteria bacterium]
MTEKIVIGRGDETLREKTVNLDRIRQPSLRELRFSRTGNTPGQNAQAKA